MTRLPKHWDEFTAKGLADATNGWVEYGTAESSSKFFDEDVLEAIRYIREHKEEAARLTLGDWLAIRMMFATCKKDVGLKYYLALGVDNCEGIFNGHNAEKVLTKEWNENYSLWQTMRRRGVNMNAFLTTVRQRFPDFILAREEDSLEHTIGAYMAKLMRGRLIWDSSYIKNRSVHGWSEYMDGRFKLLRGGGISKIYDGVVVRAIDEGVIRKEQRRQAMQQKTKDAALTWAREGTVLEVEPEALDTQLTLINMKNGTLDLRTGKLLPHRPEDMLTKTTGVTYDKDAKCPDWEEFILQISDGDRDTARFLQQALGYTLTGLTDEDSAYTLYGGGSNGKSVFMKVIAKLMGDYAVRMNIETLTAQQRSGSEHSEDVFRLKGARFCYTTEPKSGYVLNEGRFKQFCGGDTLTARTLNQASVQFDPQFKLWTGTNHLLRLDTMDKALKRRMAIIHIRHEFSGEKSRSKLVRHFVEEEGPGIFAWMVRGCLDWQRHRPIKKSAAIRAATDKYLEEENEVARFIKDHCTTGGALRQPLTDVYAEYASRVKIALRREEFRQRLLDLEFAVRVGAHNQTVVFGLRLATEKEKAER